MIKKFATFAAAAAVALTALPASAAFMFGANPSSPLSGYNLGDGRYATKIGLQFHTSGSFVGQNITLADLNSTISSGTVSAWYYAGGNPASSLFSNIDEFAPFTGDVVVAGAANSNRVWDSLFAIHTGNVVFRSNLTGGTATAGIGGQRIMDNPFERQNNVPVPGTLALIGAALLAAGVARRRA